MSTQGAKALISWQTISVLNNDFNLAIRKRSGHNADSQASESLCAFPK